MLFFSFSDILRILTIPTDVQKTRWVLGVHCIQEACAHQFVYEF